MWHEVLEKAKWKVEAGWRIVTELPPSQLLLLSAEGCSSYLPTWMASGSCAACPDPMAQPNTVPFSVIFSAGPAPQSGLLLPGCAWSAASARRNAGGCGQERKRGWDHSGCDLRTLTSLWNKTTNDFSPPISPAPCHLHIGTARSRARLLCELPAHICQQPSQ